MIRLKLTARLCEKHYRLARQHTAVVGTANDDPDPLFGAEGKELALRLSPKQAVLADEQKAICRRGLGAKASQNCDSLTPNPIALMTPCALRSLSAREGAVEGLAEAAWLLIFVRPVIDVVNQGDVDAGEPQSREALVDRAHRSVI